MYNISSCKKFVWLDNDSIFSRGEFKWSKQDESNTLDVNTIRDNNPESCI